MKMGELYKEMGLINSGHTVQATRADLVGQYIGHTGPKTKEMITRSFGGILFIDEAYGLYKEDSRDYGSEVIEMLVKFMDTTANTDFIVVLAGYRNLMTKMLNANLNLMSRMGNWIDFPDYDDAELLQISQLLAKTYGYEYDESSKKVFTEVRCRVVLWPSPPLLCSRRQLTPAPPLSLPLSTLFPPFPPFPPLTRLVHEPPQGISLLLQRQNRP
jgi:hypothetical protein